jgi:hypothetical protein
LRRRDARQSRQRGSVGSDFVTGEPEMKSARKKRKAAISSAAKALGKEVTLPKASATDVEDRIIRPVFGKYVTRNSGFVEYLHGVRDQIDTYIAKDTVKRSLNILLAAPPGSGKSFLIKQLIESIDFKARNLEVSFEESYAASLENVAELYSIFQRVQSVNLEGKLPVVFFDEIDTEIAGSKLFAKFLAPMWDGTFYVGKEKFFLGRSIFFFAGSTLSRDDVSTEILKEHREQNPHKRISYNNYFDAWKAKFDEKNKKSEEPKLPDFMDRIDEVLRIPPMAEELYQIPLIRTRGPIGAVRWT